ncbi:MAG: hypothetical protein J6C28_01595 [Bacilli bacterium]|nr:hypothetical protein [Bacilli bacterium]
MKKKIIILICVIAFVIVSCVSVIISANVTGVLNPIASVYSILKVNLDKDETYVVAQKKPWKIMIAKPYMDGKSANELLDEYMKNDGYEEYDRMGSVITYKNEKGNERRIHFSVNKYFSLWEWI